MTQPASVARAPWHQLPSVDRLLNTPIANEWRVLYGHDETVAALRQVLAEARANLT